MSKHLLRMTVAALAGTMIAAAPAAAQSFAVVVNESNPITAISRQQLSSVFLKKSKFAGQLQTSPVDLREDSPIRADFTKIVHRRPVGAVTSYWRTQIFSGGGVLPPPQRKSDAEVLDFVRTTPGAIGYVSAAADVGRGVKIIALMD